MITLTRVDAARARIDGISCPGPQSPTATSRQTCSTICWYIGRGSACEMVNAVCISIYTLYTDVAERQATRESPVPGSALEREPTFGLAGSNR